MVFAEVVVFAAGDIHQINISIQDIVHFAEQFGVGAVGSVLVMIYEGDVYEKINLLRDLIRCFTRIETLKIIIGCDGEGFCLHQNIFPNSIKVDSLNISGNISEIGDLFVSNIQIRKLMCTGTNITRVPNLDLSYLEYLCVPYGIPGLDRTSFKCDDDRDVLQDYFEKLGPPRSRSKSARN